MPACLPGSAVGRVRASPLGEVGTQGLVVLMPPGNAGTAQPGGQQTPSREAVQHGEAGQEGVGSAQGARREASS